MKLWKANRSQTIFSTNEGIQLRRNEKKLLNDINIDKPERLRYHILADKGKRKKRIQTREEKIFVLANDCLTGDPMVHDLSLIQVCPSILQVIFLQKFFEEFVGIHASYTPDH